MNLVATCNFGPLWYAEYTVPYMRRYAQEIGADFLEFAGFTNRSVYGEAYGWFHVEAIRFLAVQCRYDAMLLLDADQLVLPSCPDLFERAEGQIGVVQDMGMPRVADHYRDWSRRHFGDWPADGPYFNSGMFVISADAARRLLPVLNGPYADEWPFDQHYLNRIFTRHEEITWLPQAFNWLAPQFFEGAIQQHIVHFAGQHKHLLPNFVGRLAESEMSEKQPVEG